jgi:hypothetical protein
MNALTTGQRIGLVGELETTTFLLRDALRAVSELDPSRPVYRPPLLLLAQGLERLMKVAWCLAQLESTGRLPTSRQVRRRFGHDLPKLLGAVAAIAGEPAYRDVSPAHLADARFLASDELLARLITTVSHFGDGARYGDLDRFLDPGHMPVADSDEELDSLEVLVEARHPEIRGQNAPNLARYYTAVDTARTEQTKIEIIVASQRLIRAVARFFVWGPCGVAGREFSAQILPLVQRRDGELANLPGAWRRTAGEPGGPRSRPAP